MISALPCPVFGATLPGFLSQENCLKRPEKSVYPIFGRTAKKGEKSDSAESKIRANCNHFSFMANSKVENLFLGAGTWRLASRREKGDIRKRDIPDVDIRRARS
jgi:hypothetical protein